MKMYFELNCIEKLQEAFQQSQEQISNVKYSDAKNISLENLF